MNAWALLYDELYGDEKMTDNRVTPQESDEYDPITNIQIPDISRPCFLCNIPYPFIYNQYFSKWVFG